MAADGSIWFDTKINTDGVNKGTNEISSRVLALKNKIEKTENEAKRLKQELADMADVPVDTSVGDKIEKDLEKAKSKLREYNAEADRIGNGRQVQLTSLGLGTDNLDDILSRDKAWQKVQAQIEAAESEVSRYQRELESARAVEAQITGKDTAGYKIKEQKLQDLTGKLGVYKVQLQETQQKEQANSSQTSKSTNNYKKLSSALKTVSNKMKSVIGIAKKAASAVTGMFGKFRKGNNGLTSVNNLAGSLVKKVVRYGLGLRSLFVLFRKVRTAGIESFKSLVKSSDSVNKSISDTYSALLNLKNSIGPAFQPLVSVVAPILTNIINKVTQATQALGHFLATLTGQSYVYQAVKVQKSYADSLDDTSKATDKVTKSNEKSLASFDELNVMTNNSADNTSAADNSDTVQYKTIPTIVNNFAKQLREAFKKGDYKALGEIVADKINNALKGIKWDKIRSTAKNFANKIAKFINGAVKNLNWSLLGSTLSNGIMTAVDFLYTFLNKVKWGKIGQGIATFLNSAMETIDAKKIAKTLASIVNSAVNFAYGFVTKFKWAKLGVKIADFINKWFSSINWVKTGKTISKTITGVLDTILTALKRIKWAKIGQSIGNFFSNIDWKKIFKQVASIIGTAFNGALTALFGATNGGPLFGIADAVGSAVLAFKSWQTISGAMTAITTGLKNLKTALTGLTTGNKIGLVVTAISGLVLAISAYSKAKFENSTLGQEVQKLNNIKDDLIQIQEDVDSTLESVDDSLTDTGANLQEIDDLQDRMEELLKKGNLTPEEQAELTTIVEVLSDRVDGFDEVWDKYVKINDKGTLKLNASYDTVISKLDDVISKIKETAAEAALMSQSEEVYASLYKTSKKKEKNRKDLDEVRGKLQKAQKEYNKLTADPEVWQKNKKRVAELSDTISRLTPEVEEAQAEYDKAEEKVNKLKRTYDNLTRSISVIKGQYSDLSAVQYAHKYNLISEQDVLKNTGVSYKKYVDIMKNGTEAEKQAVQGSAAGINAALDSMGKKLNSATASNAEELKQQATDFENTYESLKEAQKGGNTAITDEMIAHAKKLADKAKTRYEKYGENINAGTAEGMERSVDKPKAQAANTQKAVIKKLSAGEGKAETVGENYSVNFSDGLNSVDAEDVGASWGGWLIQGMAYAITTAANTIKYALGTLIEHAFGDDIGGHINNFLGIDLPSLKGKTIKVPKLATGMYVPANYGEFLAVLGDNKHEPEIVAPESKIEQAVINAMGKINIGGGDINLTVTLDGATVYKSVVEYNNRDKKRRGKSRLS